GEAFSKIIAGDSAGKRRSQSSERENASKNNPAARRHSAILQISRDPEGHSADRKGQCCHRERVQNVGAYSHQSDIILQTRAPFGLEMVGRDSRVASEKTNKSEQNSRRRAD